jgi:putative methionine-R-sulfoxide reductase with GAF domain
MRWSWVRTRAPDRHNPYPPVRAGVCCLAARERRAIVLPDVRADPRYIAYSATVRSDVVVPPLLNREHVLGVLDDVDSDDIGAFGAKDQALLETVASYVVEKYRESSPYHSAAQPRVKREVHD